MNGRSKGKTRHSRRGVLGAAASVAGGALLMPDELLAQARNAGVAAQPAAAPAQAAMPEIKNSVDFVQSLAMPPRRADFSGDGMTGAPVFANLCKDENLAVRGAGAPGVISEEAR